MGVFNIKRMGLMMDKFWMNPFTVNKRFSNVFQMSARFGETPFQPTHYINIRTWQWKSTMFHDGHRKWLSTWATSTTSTLTSCTTTAWPWDSPALRTSHCKGLQPPSPSIWSTGNLVVQTFEASVSEDKAWTLSLGSNRTTTWTTWRTWPCDPCPGLLGSRHWPTDLTLWMKDGWTRLSPVQPHQREGLLGDQNRTDQTGGRDHRPTCPRWTTRDPQHYESFELADHTIGSMLAYKGFMSRFGQHQPRGRVQSLCHVCPGRDGSWPLQCGARRWWHYIGPGSPVLFGPGWLLRGGCMLLSTACVMWTPFTSWPGGHISPATCACGISTSRVGFISRSKLRMDPPRA